MLFVFYYDYYSDAKLVINIQLSYHAYHMYWNSYYPKETALPNVAAPYYSGRNTVFHSVHNCSLVHVLSCDI